MRALLVTLGFLVCGAGGGMAQDGDRLAAMRAAYADWVVRQGVSGTGAIAFEGRPAMAMGNAAAPVALGSVSKSITALCAAVLADQGRLDFTASLRDLLGAGPDVPVASLVTHTSGIAIDITQPLMGLWLDAQDHRAAMVLDLMKTPTGEPGIHVYNNVNYALLALAIEEASNAPYEDTCRRLVLEPAGVRGAPDARTGAFLSWGGWAMAPLDYARLHAHWFGPESAIGRDPFAYPHVALGDGRAFYGLGTLFAADASRDGRYTFWHAGALCFAGRFDVGTFAVTWGSGWTALLGYRGCVDDAARAELDFVMSRAARGRLP